MAVPPLLITYMILCFYKNIIQCFVTKILLQQTRDEPMARMKDAAHEKNLRGTSTYLTLTLLTWTIWRAPTNASKWRIGFNSAFKG